MKVRVVGLAVSLALVIGLQATAAMAAHPEKEAFSGFCFLTATSDKPAWTCTPDATGFVVKNDNNFALVATVEVEAEVDDLGDALLLPGYSADVEVILAERADVLRVPTRALLEGRRLYLLEDGRIRAREVTTGLGNWEYTEITGGLEAGERVVISIDREGLADGVAAVAR